MTIWDNIYKNYRKTGKKWATIEGTLPKSFLQLVTKNKFLIKSALDIGCGEGKYLLFLKEAGFKVTGIDSSRMAVAMTKKLLGQNAKITCVDMFKYKIPKNKFDVVISTSTIHHGTKKQVSDLVNRIYDNLIVGGCIFITIPNANSRKNWETFKSHKKISPGTYAPQSGPEKGLPHSFYTKNQVLQLFSKFKIIKISSGDFGKWVVEGIKE